MDWRGRSSRWMRNDSVQLALVGLGLAVVVGFWMLHIAMRAFGVFFVAAAAVSAAQQVGRAFAGKSTQWGEFRRGSLSAGVSLLALPLLLALGMYMFQAGPVRPRDSATINLLLVGFCGLRLGANWFDARHRRDLKV